MGPCCYSQHSHPSWCIDIYYAQLGQCIRQLSYWNGLSKSTNCSLALAMPRVQDDRVDSTRFGPLLSFFSFCWILFPYSSYQEQRTRNPERGREGEREEKKTREEEERKKKQSRVVIVLARRQPSGNNRWPSSSLSPPSFSPFFPLSLPFSLPFLSLIFS